MNDDTPVIGITVNFVRSYPTALSLYAEQRAAKTQVDETVEFQKSYENWMNKINLIVIGVSLGTFGGCANLARVLIIDCPEAPPLQRKK